MMMAQKTVTGSVVSAEDGEPIIGATVVVTGTTTGAVTDVDGNFSIKAPESAKTLTVSYVGMETQQVAIKNGKMKVVLSTNNEVLDEVMVVAFGSAKKSAFTGSAKSIAAEKLEMSQVTSVTSALAGAVPGVTLTSSNGAPGSSPTIRVRGFSSLNAGNDPLVIVDGAPYSGDMTSLNPNDVESMTVLKDAASAALYGSRGANGVIIITTKQGKANQKAVVTVDAKIGGNTSALQHYDVISSPAEHYEQHYKSLYNAEIAGGSSAVEAWRNANALLCGRPDQGGLGYNIWTIPTGQYLIGTDGRLNPNATLGRVAGNYYLTPDDWEKIGTRTGTRQEYNVSVAGSTDKSSTYLSLGYLSNEGITANSDYERLSARLRSDYQVNSWLKVGANMSYARFDQNSLSDNGNSTSTGNIWAFTSQIAPIYPAYVRNADGSIMVDDNGFRVMDYGSGQYPGCDRPFIQDANPIMDNMLNTRNYEGNATSGHMFADATILPGLVFTVNASYDLDETRHTTVLNKYYGQFDSTGGVVEKYHSRTYSYNTQQLLNYTKTFADKHNLNVMIGHEFYKYNFAYLSASKSKMFSDDNKELAGAVVDGKSAYSYKETYNVEGYLGRVQYDYNEKYFGSFSYRRDASSRFTKDNRWGSFWSLGGAWIISKEDWFKVQGVDQFKYKASIGSQGNQSIGNYRYSDQYTISNSNGNVGTAFSSKGNPNITWETQTNFNTGFEFQLFKRLTGSVEYYYRKTSDMLMRFSVAPSIGYTSYYSNVGDMHNTGVEVDLNINLYHNKNINWDLSLNLSTIKNRIDKLDAQNKTASFYTASGKEVKGFTSGSFFVAEGQSIYTWRMREFAGVDHETGEPLWYKNKFDDNGNWTGRETTKKYSDADYYVTEETTVPKVEGGFGTSVSAYGFDLSVNCSYQLGGKAYDATYAGFMYSPTSAIGGYSYHKDLKNAWTPENKESNIPRFQYGDQYTSSMSTRFLTKSNYLNIQNINLGYTIPARFLSKASISSIRLYVSAENVAYFSARKGFDPRQSYSEAADATNYSPMRTVSGGVTLKF